MEVAEAGALALQHLFVLCCYGGAPFIDYHKSIKAAGNGGAAPRTIDPTDWMAFDLSGSLLNATLHPQFMAQHPHLTALVPNAESGVQLDACDLYNLTFSSAADQNLFHRFHGVFMCRCEPGRYGRSCEYSNVRTISGKTTTVKSTTIKTTGRSAPREPITVVSLKEPTIARITRRLSSTDSTSAFIVNSTTVSATTTRTTTVMSVASTLLSTTLSATVSNVTALAMTSGGGSELPARWTFSTFLVILLAIMLAMIGCFRAMRGCFCDCFSGFKNPFGGAGRYDAPIDPAALHRCIDAVDAYERAEKNKNLAGSRRPLILSVSDECPTYNPTVISGGGAPHDAPHFGATRQQSHNQPEPQQVRPAQQRQQRAYSPPPSYHSSNGSLNMR